MDEASPINSDSSIPHFATDAVNAPPIETESVHIQREDINKAVGMNLDQVRRKPFGNPRLKMLTAANNPFGIFGTAFFRT